MAPIADILTIQCRRSCPKLFGVDIAAVHPVVIVGPVTNRKALYANRNYTERIVGFSEMESDSVLRMLFDHVNALDFHVGLSWDMKTLVIWENRVTRHRA